MNSPATLPRWIWFFVVIAIQAPLSAMAQVTVAPLEAHFGYAGLAGQSAYLGVAQGLAEANLQGQFLGQRYVLHQQPAKETTSPLSAIFVAADADALKRLSAQHPNTPIFNLTLDDEALRAECLPNVLHIPPSRRMKEGALAQWRKLHPESKVAAQSWHPDFKKYAAEQLNRRFLKAQGRPMDDAAWAGWAAVKMLTDTIARLQVTDPAKLLEYLKTALQFDGQKGVDMNFRPTGQLRQVLFLVENGQVVGEAPVKGVVDPQDLDSLGPSGCPK
jgi:hypothetical protein